MRSIRDIFKSYAVFSPDGKHINGTDKESNHRYGDAYEKLFTIQDVQSDPGNLIRSEYPYSIRNDVQLMMEVGVADGSSILAWREIFPNATCVGMDIHNASRLYNEERVEFYFGDQCSKRDCDYAAKGRQFDLIVEDATHELPNTLLTFLFLWPYVKPGGFYIVEEFPNIGALRDNIRIMWPNVIIIDTEGPFGGIEPIVAFRKH